VEEGEDNKLVHFEFENFDDVSQFSDWDPEALRTYSNASNKTIHFEGGAIGRGDVALQEEALGVLQGDCGLDSGWVLQQH
jgi:hypothetical protein